MAEPTSVLRVAASGRYLVDADDRPFFINGDSPWSAVVSLLPDEHEAYFADRATRGFNAALVNAIETLFSADPPRTVDGLEPFVTPGDLTTPNPDYWARVDSVLDAAGRHGIHVLLAPLYLGFVDPHYPGFGFTAREEGWHRAVAANDEAACRAYGAFLGRRYRARENLVWVIGGDRHPRELLPKMRAFVAGILDHDDRHLLTAHVNPDDSPIDTYEGDTWITLNQTYSYRIVHRRLIDDYRRRPTLPFFLSESTYEGEHEATDLQIRRQAWWAVTCGATGHVFGSFPAWLLPPGWETALDTPGARAMTHVGAFVDAIRWWTLVPDLDRRFLVAGLGEENGLDRATAAISEDGSLAVAYLPTPRTVTVNLGALTGWVTRVRWFDPVTGDWSANEVRSPRGFEQLTSPGDHDAVLVLDDPAVNRHGSWRRTPA